MDVTLSVEAYFYKELQDVVRHLCATLNKETDVRATLIEEPAFLERDNVTVHDREPAEVMTGREAPTFVGTIGLALLTEITAKIVVEILFSYVERNPALRRLTFRDRKQGRELPLSPEDLQPDSLPRTIDRVREFARGAS